MNGPKFLSEAEYDALPGMRASYAKTLWHSTPAHLRASMEEKTDSDAFRFGRALHCALLRPIDFAGEFAVSPRFDRRTKQGKEDAAEFEARAAGATVIDEAEYAAIEAVRASIAGNASAVALLDMAETREAAFVGSIAGVPAKCRADAVGLKSGVLLDVKTCISAAPRAFARSCADFAYHLQMAFYRSILRENGVAVSDVVLIAAEKAKPYAVALYRMREEDLDAMTPTLERCARLYQDCIERNDFPGYGDSVRELAMPDWSIHGGNAQ